MAPPARRAWTLVWDAEESLYPCGVFQDEQDAKMGKEALVTVLVEKTLEQEARDVEAGDLPIDERILYRYFRSKLSIDRWTTLPFFPSLEFAQCSDNPGRLYAELSDYVESSEELQAAAYEASALAPDV